MTLCCLILIFTTYIWFNKGNNEKLALISSFVLFSSSVFAGSCPMIALDAKIAEAQELKCG